MNGYGFFAGAAKRFFRFFLYRHRHGLQLAVGKILTVDAELAMVGVQITDDAAMVGDVMLAVEGERTVVAGAAISEAESTSP